MTIINANTSSINVLNACKEHCKLGKEVSDGRTEGGREGKNREPVGKERGKRKVGREDWVVG